ncbi:MAG: phosphotransferase family protein [Acidimicrobiales bacterium]
MRVPRRTFIPSQPGDLTPRWLTDQLRAHGGLPATSEVVGFDVGPLGGGQGLSGELMRVSLRYHGDQGRAPDSVIAKFPTTNLQNRGMIEALGTYEREISFYRGVAGQVPIRVPRHFGSDFDTARLTTTAKAGGSRLLERMPAGVHVAVTRDVTKFMRATSRRYALLIEDMGDGQVYDLVEPPGPELLEQVLGELAVVHSHFWGGEGLESVARQGRAVTHIPVVQANVARERAIPACIERWPDLTDAQIAMLYEAAERFPEDTARLNRPITLIHGDTRTDNVIYRDDGSLALLDWAMTSVADPGFDVGYLLSSSVMPDDGRPMARKLAEAYHEALTAHGVAHPFDDLWESIEACCRAQLVQMALTVVFFEASYGDVDPCDLWIPRALACLLD